MQFKKVVGPDGKGAKDLRVESEMLEGLPDASKLITEEVCKYMRPGNIALVAKKDKLISNLGENLPRRCVGMDSIKINRLSEDERECARLLIHHCRLKPSIVL